MRYASLLAATLLACAGGTEDSEGDERDSRAGGEDSDAQEESIEALENRERRVERTSSRHCARTETNWSLSDSGTRGTLSLAAKSERCPIRTSGQRTRQRSLLLPEGCSPRSGRQACGGVRGAGLLPGPPRPGSARGTCHASEIRRRRDSAHSFPSRIRRKRRRPLGLHSPSRASEQRRVRPAAPYRSIRQRGCPLLEPHRPVL